MRISTAWILLRKKSVKAVKFTAASEHNTMHIRLIGAARSRSKTGKKRKHPKAAELHGCFWIFIRNKKLNNLKNIKFQIISLGYIPKNRVIRSLLTCFDLAQLNPGILCGIVKHLSEKLVGHEM